MNQVVGKNGEIWALDDGLRKKAKALVDKYTEVAHVDPDRIVFVRLLGKKQTGKKVKAGKCQKIKEAEALIPYHCIEFLKSLGLLDDAQLQGIENDLFDLRFIITIDDNALAASGGNMEDTEEVVLLHELMHINEDQNGIEPHDSEDFKFILEAFGVRWFEEGRRDGKRLNPVSFDKLKKNV